MNEIGQSRLSKVEFQNLLSRLFQRSYSIIPPLRRGGLAARGRGGTTYETVVLSDGHALLIRCISLRNNLWTYGAFPRFGFALPSSSP